MVFSGNSSFTLALTFIIILNLFLSGFSGMTVSSRIGYAMARDGAFPFSNFLKELNPDTKTPDRIIMLMLCLSSILCLLPLYSETAFTAITSLATVGVQMSYALPIYLRVTSSKDSFKRDAWNLGSYSILVGSVSVAWLVFASMILFMPHHYDPVDGITLKNFNYSSVVFLIALVIASVYWNLPRPYGAKHFFKGPRRDEDREQMIPEDRECLLKKERTEDRKEEKYA